MLFRAIRYLDYYRSVKGKLLLPKKLPCFSRECSKKKTKKKPSTLNYVQALHFLYHVMRISDTQCIYL